MADGRESAAWDRTAEICNLIYNANRKSDAPPTSADDWHPYRMRDKVKPKPADISILKVILHE